MTDALKATPDFVCAESIERTDRTASGQSSILPPLRVEAGVIAGKELYARPVSDAGTVRLRPILSLFNRAGTGSYALYSRAVFLTANATFYEMPYETKNGRRLLREDFAMPRDGSKCSLPTSKGPVAVGYSGSIWTDPDSLKLVRLALQADNIPADTAIKTITQTLDFGDTNIAGNAVLVPVSTDLVFQEQSGAETRLVGHFSGCHQYIPNRGDRFLEIGNEGQVTISTEEVSGSESPVVTPAADLLPRDTRIETTLKQPIDERTTKAGDKLSFTILREIKAHGKVIVPKGSAAAGHVTRIIMLNYLINTSVKRYYLVGLQFDSITVRHQTFPVRANLENVGSPAKGIAFIPYSHDPDKWGVFDDIYQLLLCPKPADGESFLGIVREFLRLSGDIRIYWSTEPPQT